MADYKTFKIRTGYIKGGRPAPLPVLSFTARIKFYMLNYTHSDGLL